KYGILQQAMAAAERIFELLDTPVDVAAVAIAEVGGESPAAAGSGRPLPAPLPTRHDPMHAATNGAAHSGQAIRSPAGDARAPGRKAGVRVEFDHVWFAYVDTQWVLEDVSFTIE